jgi:hypothetical protein
MSTVRALLAVAAILSASCGGAPAAPTVPAPTIAQIAGAWNGSTVVTAVSGGECVGDLDRSLIGSTDPINVAITQIGSAVTAIVTSQATGNRCSFAGTVAVSNFVFNGSACSVMAARNIRCANGATRDMLWLAQSFTGAASGATLTGTSGESYDILGSFGVSTGTPLVINKSFVLTR